MWSFRWMATARTTPPIFLAFWTNSPRASTWSPDGARPATINSRGACLPWRPTGSFLHCWAYLCTTMAAHSKLIGASHRGRAPVWRDAPLYPDLCSTRGGERDRASGDASPAPPRQIKIRLREDLPRVSGSTHSVFHRSLARSPNTVLRKDRSPILGYSVFDVRVGGSSEIQ